MEALVNGKFKALISQLLRSAGVASYEEGGESWVEVIASLSWEAASLLKPDAVVAKARDLLYTHAHTHSQWTRSSSTSSALNLCPVIASSNCSVIYLAVLELTLQVLLKIAQSDALKVKSVVQCAVFLAYHLILETAFFVDQRATLSYADVATDLPTDTETLTLRSINSRVPHNTDTSAENESDAVDILISNESHEGCSDSSTLEFKGNSTFDVPHNPALLSGFSSISVALRKVMGKGYRTLWFHNVERLSELPFNIIHHMLSRLTLKDIACTALFQRHVMGG
ncbi:hypothetical protein PS2_002690 [Malus domestica]